MSFTTADLCDAHPDALVVRPGLADFGARRVFAGPISTVRCFDDNSLVGRALEEPGEGRVLVVDGAGSLGAALLGDRLAALGAANGWSGVVINGCVRDTAELRDIELGIKALASHPRRTLKAGAGERDVVVAFGGVDFVPGAWVYADTDGILVLPDEAS